MILDANTTVSCSIKRVDESRQRLFALPVVSTSVKLPITKAKIDRFAFMLCVNAARSDFSIFGGFIMKRGLSVN